MNPATLPTSTTGEFSLSTTQLANIENALSLALFHIRKGESLNDLHRATGKAVRAAALLKQAVTSNEGGAA